MNDARSRNCLIFAALLALCLLMHALEADAGTCAIRTSPGAMSFGAIDPSLPGPINATVTIQPMIRCSAGLPFTVTSRSANAGGPFASPPIIARLRDTGGHTINYLFSHLANGTGLGLGGAANISLNVSGSTTSADYANAYYCVAPCSYTDTVTLTVTW